MIKKPKRLAYILNISIEELYYIAENINQYYYEKKEPKLNKDGTPKYKNGIPQYRILEPSRKPLKAIQTRIKNRILNNFELPLNIQGGVKKKDNISNAKIHQGKKYHFITDLKDFFPTINNKMIYDMFIRLNFTPDVSRLLTILTTYHGHLPQGTPTSAHIANLVFLPIDKMLIDLSNEFRLFYTRFFE